MPVSPACTLSGALNEGGYLNLWWDVANYAAKSCFDLGFDPIVPTAADYATYYPYSKCVSVFARSHLMHKYSEVVSSTMISSAVTLNPTRCNYGVGTMEAYKAKCRPAAQTDYASMQSDAATYLYQNADLFSWMIGNFQAMGCTSKDQIFDLLNGAPVPCVIDKIRSFQQLPSSVGSCRLQ